MSVTDYIPTLGGDTTDDDAPTLETLESLFREREATLDLTAQFHLPNGNTQDEPTAVFPYTLLDADGEEYGTGAKEFIIPDNGFNDNNAPVTEFVAGLTDTPAEDVGVSDLRAVQSATADAELNDNGDVVVTTPDAPTADNEVNE